MRLLRIFTLVTCPLLAVAAWYEWDGIPRFLATAVAMMGAVGAVIEQREKRAAQGIDDLITLNLHRSGSRNPL